MERSRIIREGGDRSIPSSTASSIIPSIIPTDTFPSSAASSGLICSSAIFKASRSPCDATRYFTVFSLGSFQTSTISLPGTGSACVSVLSCKRRGSKFFHVSSNRLKDGLIWISSISFRMRLSLSRTAPMVHSRRASSGRNSGTPCPPD